MADYTAFRDALTAAIEGVSGTGVVQKRQREITDWTEYLKSFVAANVTSLTRVRGWWVVRERREDDWDAFGRIDSRHTFVMRAILGIEDRADTDATFGDMVDDVMDAVTGLSVTNAWDVGACVARVIEPRVFGGVLCHYAEVEVVLSRESAA